MILLCLLFVAHGGGSKKSMLTELKERVQAVRAGRGKPLDNIDEEFKACMAKWAADNPKADEEDGYEAIGECCANRADKSEWCNEFARYCEKYGNGDYDDDYYQQQDFWDTVCPAYCDEVSSRPDWCGLSTGAIIGIVVGAVVFVGVVAGLLVYFLIIKKKEAD
jgi:hypothetical protein